MWIPITQARAEIEKCAWVCDYYARHAASFLEDSTLEADFQDAGFPPHLLRNAMVNKETLRFAFVRPAVQGITLTGSTQAGRTVAASAATQLKKSVLELGGSDPYLWRLQFKS